MPVYGSHKWHAVQRLRSNDTAPTGRAPARFQGEVLELWPHANTMTQGRARRRSQEPVHVAGEWADLPKTGCRR